MKARLMVLSACLLAMARPAAAHRLDEYLLSTLIAVEKDRVVAEMRLAPGVAVVPSVLAAIDTDGNGRLSKSEQQAYAMRVVQDLSLTLNDAVLPLRVVAAEFPEVEAMTEGRGDIRLELCADLPPSIPERTLRFQNRHQRQIAIYQVNRLVSSESDIRVGAERRDYAQSVYELKYTQISELKSESTDSVVHPTSGPI